jgi:hypothetical protein
MTPSYINLATSLSYNQTAFRNSNNGMNLTNATVITTLKQGNNESSHLCPCMTRQEWPGAVGLIVTRLIH